ncbi:MAG: hypothetical protein JO257_01815 [Deltaproteobacteria bacterium]|nr:hypothetical protein [Deltaproteobacteria bacterium]
MLAAPAFADPVAPAKEDTAPAKDDAAPAKPDAPSPVVDHGDIPTTYHKGQFGLSARLSLGAQAIATYDSKLYCGTVDATAANGNAPVCAARSPVSLGFEASYGVGRGVDLVLELRIGLEKEFGPRPMTDGPHPLFFAPGARFFFSEAKRTRLFAQPEVVFDFTPYKDASGNSRGNDFGFRGLEGIWLDLHKTYGMYAFVGETLEFVRWIDANFEAGVGFQGRYP